MRGTFCCAQCELPLSDATGHVIDPCIVCGDIDADRINVRRRQISFGPKAMCGKSKQARARANVGDYLKSFASPFHSIEHHQATAGGFMAARAKGAACLNQERRRAIRHGSFVRTGVNIETARMNRL